MAYCEHTGASSPEAFVRALGIEGWQYHGLRVLVSFLGSTATVPE